MIWRVMKTSSPNYITQNTRKTNKLNGNWSVTTIKQITNNIKSSRLHMWQSIRIQFPKETETLEIVRMHPNVYNVKQTTYGEPKWKIYILYVE